MSQKFPDTSKLTLDEWVELLTNPMTFPLKLDECQRQMVLMALAHLAVERPGWDYMLSQIALQIDDALVDGLRHRPARHGLDAMRSQIREVLERAVPAAGVGVAVEQVEAHLHARRLAS